MMLQVTQSENEQSFENEAFACAFLSAQKSVAPILWDGEDIYTQKNMELLIQTCMKALHSASFFMKIAEFDLKDDWLCAKSVLQHIPSGKSQNYELKIPFSKGEWAYAHTKAMALFLRGLLFPSYELKSCRERYGPEKQVVNCG